MDVGSLVGGSSEIIGREATLAQAAQAVIRGGTGSMAVVDGRELAGILTEKDIVRAISEGADPEAEAVGDWMSEAPDTISPDTDVDEAAAWLLEMGYRHLPVVDEGELLGIVSMRDLLWAITSS